MKKQKELFRVVRKKYIAETTTTNNDGKKYKLVEDKVVFSSTSYNKVQRKFKELRIELPQNKKEVHIIHVEIFDDTISNFRGLSYEEYVRYEHV